ncbi:MAG: hypothetical protein NZM43_13605 [Saprospiraceae bacterium]|nr:hypothetical protein [Saprospiraceae bacterium]MDW8485350.1 hypothetical protein [Saprospiraceae bacterium]
MLLPTLFPLFGIRVRISQYSKAARNAPTTASGNHHKTTPSQHPLMRKRCFILARPQASARPLRRVKVQSLMFV